MSTQSWTLTIKNGSSDALQAPNGLDSLVAGTPTGAPPQWGLAPGAETTLTCSIESAQKNPLTGTMSWIGANGTATLNWIVPNGGSVPTYSPNFTGNYSVTASNTSSAAVTYTIVGSSTASSPTSPPGTSPSGPAPPGAPVSVAPTTGATSVSKSKAPQLWILGDAKGAAFPHFNCGYYPDIVEDRLPGEETYGDKVPNPVDASGSPRTADGVQLHDAKSTHYRRLQGSGCGLFALSTILGGYDAIVPDWDTTANAFKPTTPMGTVDMRTPKNGTGPGGQMGSPRAFLHFIWHYIIANNTANITTEARAKLDLSTKILAPDPNGALYFAGPLETALAFMFTYHSLSYDAQGNYLSPPRSLGLSFMQRVEGNWPGGTAVPAITDSIINAHQPVIIGVGPPDQCWHQVLVVGVAKYDGNTYYIAIDSGFSGDNHPGPLLSVNVPLSWPKILQYTIGAKAGWSRPKIPNIHWYRTVTDLMALANGYDFTLYCKGVKEW